MPENRSLTRSLAHCARSLSTVLSALWIAVVPLPVHAEHAQPTGLSTLEQLRQQTYSALEQRYRSGDPKRSTPPHEQVDITLSRLDPRLKLGACSEAPVLEIKDQGARGGNISIRARCLQPQPWSIVMTARIDILAPIWVAQHNLQRGTILTRRDLVQKKLNLSQINPGHITDVDQILGKQLQRHLKQHSPVRSSHLSEPWVIKKGDAISIAASSGAVSVHSEGSALDDGRVGQQIRVVNERSKRVIKARVTAAGQVSTTW